MLVPEARPLANHCEFNRYLNPISEQRRQHIVESTGYNHRARKIFFEPYFRGLLIFTWTKGICTLRDLRRYFNDDPLYAVLGAHIDASLSSFSDANAKRPVTPFLMILDDVLDQLQKVPTRYRALTQIEAQDLEQIQSLLDRSVLFDSSSLTLPAQVAEWAEVADDQASVNLHLRLRNGVGGIDQVFVVPGRDHDSRYFHHHLDLTRNAGHIHLFDCGFRGISTYDEIVDSGNEFVTTRHGRLSVETVKERPLPASPGDSGYKILRDRIVHIGKGERHSPHLYRLLEVVDTEGEHKEILTSLLELPADHICWLKRYHWMIEILIRWLKHTLNLDHLISHSPRGIIVQVAMTLIAWGLMVLYHQQLRRNQPFSPTKMLRDLRIAFHRQIFWAGYMLGLKNAHLGQPMVPAPIALPPP